MHVCCGKTGWLKQALDEYFICTISKYQIWTHFQFGQCQSENMVSLLGLPEKLEMMKTGNAW